MQPTILIAEDDSVVRDCLEEFLSELGFRILVRHDGKAALEILRTDPDIVLLITDMRMPGMNGRELIDAVRSAPGLADLPVILISAYVQTTDIDHLTRHPATRFLSKPVSLFELESLIVQFLGPTSASFRKPDDEADPRPGSFTGDPYRDPSDA